MSTGLQLFKAFIRVVKSIKGYNDFDSYHFADKVEIRIPVIEAPNKEWVKTYLLENYPQFFQNGKVYERETKDKAQFFYVVIYPLYEWEKRQIEEGQWTCSECGQVHENKYVSRPFVNDRLFAGMIFCKSENNVCYETYKKNFYKDIELPDDEHYIKRDSPNWIYKITEKSTGKCYIGKTRNAPFFRWWNHLAHSSSPFGLYLKSKKLSEFTFEVLEELPAETSDTDVFDIESKYIVQFDSIKNGFNSLISKKQQVPSNQIELTL